VGTQFLCLGILAEMITAFCIRHKDLYSIRELLRVTQDEAEGTARTAPLQTRD